MDRLHLEGYALGPSIQGDVVELPIMNRAAFDRERNDGVCLIRADEIVHSKYEWIDAQELKANKMIWSNVVD